MIPQDFHNFHINYPEPEDKGESEPVTKETFRKFFTTVPKPVLEMYIGKLDEIFARGEVEEAIFMATALLENPNINRIDEKLVDVLHKSKNFANPRQNNNR